MEAIQGGSPSKRCEVLGLGAPLDVPGRLVSSLTLEGGVVRGFVLFEA